MSAPNTVSKPRPSNSYLGLVTAYIIILTIAGIVYLVSVFGGLSSSSAGMLLFPIILIMIVTSAVGAIRLLIGKLGVLDALVSLSALVLWALAGAFINFGSTCFDCFPTIWDYTKPFPFGFPLVSSLAMIGLLYIGWKRCSQ